MVILQIVVTEKCNLSCPYCYMNNRNTFLTREAFTEFYESLPSDQDYKIDFFGGEPLLNWDIVKFITETVHSDSRCKSIYLPSNGVLLTQDMVDFIKHYKVDFSWSCEGEDLSKYHDNIDIIRQLTNVVNVVVTGNVIDFISNYERFTDIGFTPCYKVIREGWTDESSDKFKSEYVRFIDYLIHSFKTRRKLFVPVNIFGNVKSMFSYTKCGDKVLRCIDRERVCLMPDGSRGFCAMMCVAGDLSFPDCVVYEKCVGCEIEPICRQGCYYTIKLEGISDHLCDVYKTLHRESMRFNHELRDDVIWKNRYIRRMFYDTNRNV